jgi:uncharacterized repeat protein (TIGR01451 family)/CSLREA domain-containing protein
MRRFTRLVVAIVGLLASVSLVEAATFTVDSTADASDATPGDGVCASAAGACTLRAAIQEANALAGLDTIEVPAGTYVLTMGELQIQSDLVINGAGAGQTTVDGNQLSRIFSVTAEATASILAVSIANGRHEPTLSARGGAILNAGSLLVEQSVVRHSAAAAFDGGQGGGIHNTGSLELVDSAVRDNSAGFSALGSGGGIYSTGTLILTRSTVHHNTVPVGLGTLSGGGGIANAGGGLILFGSTVRDNSGDSGAGIATNGTASVLESTVRDNSARTGGGIVNAGTLLLLASTVSGNSATESLNAFGGGLVNTGSVALVNSTISDNEVRGVLSATGGGIANSGVLTSTNSTIADNAAQVDGPDPSARVGGLFNNGRATLGNTIVADSFGADCGPPGAITSLGHNLDSDGTCGLSSPGDLSGADPLLGPLANNGGPTETHALENGSPAIDAGDNAGCPATDQRGTARPQGAACDIGAFERGGFAASADLVLVKTASTDEVRVGDVLVYTLTVTNSGPAAATSVVLTEPLSDRVTLLETRPSQGTCRAGPAKRTAMVTCSLGELPPEATATVTIVVSPTRPGEVINTAFATGGGDDPDLRNNWARTRTHVRPAR